MKLSRKLLRRMILNEIRQMNEAYPGGPRFDLEDELEKWFNSLPFTDTEPGQKLQLIDGMLKVHPNYDNNFEQDTKTPRKRASRGILKAWYDSLSRQEPPYKITFTDPRQKLSMIKAMLEAHPNYDRFFGK